VDGAWQPYLAQHEDRFDRELMEFLAIPSVSTDPERRQDVRRAQEWVRRRLETAGLQDARILETPGHPLVYASWLGAPGRPTVLIYGHADVQPPEPLDLWLSPPFEPQVRDGRVYARGASDMKGNLLAAIAACEARLATEGRLPVNVKFLCEAEEEVGSPSLPAVLAAERDLLAADLAVSADSGQAGEDQPMIVTGLRGLAGLEVSVRTARVDLHSGLAGGIAPNAVHVLVDLLASLRDRSGRIVVEGFHDGVLPLSDEEREEIGRIPDDTPALLAAAGIAEPAGDPDFSPRERNWVRPTLEVNGIGGGYQGEGVKTVIPCEARAKITCRLVPEQSPAQVRLALERHLRRHAPAGVELTLAALPGEGSPYLLPAAHPGQAAAARTLEAIYGKTPYQYRLGASVPITASLKDILGVDTVAFGFSLFDEGMHAPNEFVRLSSLRRGREAFCRLLGELAAYSKTAGEG